MKEDSDGTAKEDSTLAPVGASIFRSGKQMRFATGSNRVVVSLFAGLGALQFLSTWVAFAVIAVVFLLGLVWIVTPPDRDKLAWWQAMLRFIESCWQRILWRGALRKD